MNDLNETVWGTFKLAGGRDECRTGAHTVQVHCSALRLGDTVTSSIVWCNIRQYKTYRDTSNFPGDSFVDANQFNINDLPQIVQAAYDMLRSPSWSRCLLCARGASDSSGHTSYVQRALP